MNKTRKTATLFAALAALALAGASGSALADRDHWKGHKHHKYDRHHNCPNVVAYPRTSRSYYYVQPQVRYYHDDYAPTRYYDGGGRGDIVFQYRYRY